MQEKIYNCETCDKLVIKKYGSGRFCSRACANTRKHSLQTKERISASLNNHYKQVGYENYSIESLELLTSNSNINRHIKCKLLYEINPKVCPICNSILPYEKRHLKTCGNPICVKSQVSKSSKHTKECIGNLVLGRHIVYKIINDFDDRYYIGVRKVNNDEKDKYLGSGVHIKNMVKCYGRDHFSRITLFEFDNSHDAFEKEKELLQECLKDPNCINLATGGQGGATFTGRHHNETTKAILAQKTHEAALNRNSEEKARISQKIAEAFKYKPNVNKGKICIYKEGRRKLINPLELEKYLAQGFTKDNPQRNY